MVSGPNANRFTSSAKGSSIITKIFIKFLMIKFLFYIRDFELDLVSIWEDSKLLQEWFYFSYTTLKGSKYQSTNFIQKLKSLSDNPTSQQEFMTLIQP